MWNAQFSIFRLQALVQRPDFERRRVVIDRCEGGLAADGSEGKSERAARVLFYRGFSEYYINNREQAAEDFDRAFERDPSLLPADVGKALSYSIRNNNAAGLKLLRQTEGKVEERGVSDAEGIYKVAKAYAVLGDKVSALHMLRHSIGGGFFPYPYFERDPLLESLRNEPEFQTLMQQALHRHEQFKATLF